MFTSWISGSKLGSANERTINDSIKHPLTYLVEENYTLDAFKANPEEFVDCVAGINSHGGVGGFKLTEIMTITPIDI